MIYTTMIYQLSYISTPRFVSQKITKNTIYKAAELTIKISQRSSSKWTNQSEGYRREDAHTNKAK